MFVLRKVPLMALPFGLFQGFLGVDAQESGDSRLSALRLLILDLEKLRVQRVRLLRRLLCLRLGDVKSCVHSKWNGVKSMGVGAVCLICPAWAFLSPGVVEAYLVGLDVIIDGLHGRAGLGSLWR